MKKVILTLVVGLFFVAFSNAQSKKTDREIATQKVKAEVKKTTDNNTVYTVKEGNALSATEGKKSCAGKSKSKACCTGKSKSKSSCAGKSKASCAGKSKASCAGSKKTEMKKTM